MIVIHKGKKTLLTRLIGNHIQNRKREDQHFKGILQKKWISYPLSNCLLPGKSICWPLISWQLHIRQYKNGQHFQKLNKINLEPRNLYSAKLFFKCQDLKKCSIHEAILRKLEDEFHLRKHLETSAKDKWILLLIPSRQKSVRQKRKIICKC